MSRRIRNAIVAAVAPVALAPLTAPAPAAAQESARDVLERALEEYESRVADIRSYTVTQQVMGVESTVTFERSTVDGHTVFVPAGAEDRDVNLESPMTYFPKVAERATLGESLTVDGGTCRQVVVRDFEGLDFGQAMPQEAGQFEPTEAVFCLDTGDWVVRRVTIDGEMVRDGERNPVHLVATLQDYRRVEGMPYPFLTTIEAQGMSGSMTPEERERARQQLEEMERRMENMPEGQRRMMEEMLQGQLQNLRKMLEGDALELEVRVTDLQVNGQ